MELKGNEIAFIFELVMANSQFYQLEDILLSGLTATEISLVAHLLGLADKFLYANKYLNPLRELDPFLITFPLLIKQGFRVLILGEGVVDLMERIQSVIWVHAVSSLIGMICTTTYNPALPFPTLTP